MNSLDKHYQSLLEEILEYGTKKQTRNGEVLSLFGRQIRHRMREGFPLLTTKKMAWKSIVTELLWFLRGDTNIKYLVDNGCNIWNGDAYNNYLKKRTFANKDNVREPVTLKNGMTGERSRQFTQEEFINRIKTDDDFAKKWGELGPVYGKQWRSWETITKKWWNDPEYQGYGSDSRSGWEYNETQIDQITNLINDLKTNPDSRRLIVNAWNVGELDSMVLPPCHYGFQVYTRELSMDERQRLYFETCNQLKTPSIKGSTNKEKMESYFQEYNIPTRAISLIWQQRSADTFLGLPFNIASYALLLEIIAKEVNMVPDELIGNLGDVHLYSNHIEQAKEQLTREPFELPKLSINTEFWQTESGECGVGLLSTSLKGFEISDFEIIDYQSHPTIKAPLSN